jgi:UDP-N-acetylmuramate--alanine ligase
MNKAEQRGLPRSTKIQKTAGDVLAGGGDLVSTDVPMSRRFTAGPVHFIGIGGCGMSGLARIMLADGLRVTGSDARDSQRLAALKALGATLYVGHAPEQLGEPLTVVYSTAIPADNPELRLARARGIPVLHRAVALANLMAGDRAVAVTGTHGKTTTSAMLALALRHCGADPSFAIGGEFLATGTNAHRGGGGLFVSEADESDGAFLRLGAEIGIITNIEPDHLDYWGNFEALIAAFEKFALDIGARRGFIVGCLDDVVTARVIARVRADGVRVLTYGFSPAADFHICRRVPDGAGWTFTVAMDGGQSPPIRLQVPGTHNALNATAALATAMTLGYSPVDAIAGLKHYSGTRRRCDRRGEADGIQVYDDFAHHPTEVAACLRAARELAGRGRLIIAFQAHHYYRTAMFIQEFGAALGMADGVVVLEVFAPGEEPIPGANGRGMTARISLPANQRLFEPNPAAVPRHLVDWAKPGDLIMTIGQGDVATMAPTILSLLRDRSASRSVPPTGSSASGNERSQGFAAAPDSSSAARGSG